MTEPTGGTTPPSSVRIGTAERNEALSALDAHLEAGRLDAMEYGERSARVAEARTADEVRPLFADLPAPHPRLPGGPSASVEPVGPVERSPGVLETWGPRVAAIMPFVAVALFFLVPGQNWLFFLLVPAAGVLFRGAHPDRDRHGRRTHRDERDEGRDERRGSPGRG